MFPSTWKGNDLVAMETPETLLAYLEGLKITTSTMVHPAVYTVEEAKTHRKGMVGAHSKNLFLRDKKGKMFLLTALEDQPIDLKALREPLEARGLSFASPERLRTYLGVEPGSVTPFAVINDTGNDVKMVLDENLLAHTTLNFHPLVNTATTSISPADLLRFLEATNHTPQILTL